MEKSLDTPVQFFTRTAVWDSRRAGVRRVRGTEDVCVFVYLLTQNAISLGLSHRYFGFDNIKILSKQS